MMRSLCFVLAVLAIAAHCQAQTVQLQTQYTTKEPDTLDLATSSIWYKMSTCATNGATATYTIDPVIPFAAWDYESGNVLQVTAYDGLSSNCQTQLCQNNITANGLCVFQTQSTVIYINVQNSVTTSLTYSINVVNGNPYRLPLADPIKTSQGCPQQVTSLQRVIQMNQPATVPTSNVASKGNQYTFSLCGISAPSATITYNALATTPASAISTYLCTVSPCAPNPSGGSVVASDRSGSGYNSFVATNVVGSFGMLVEGWGSFNSSNYYVFTIKIQDSD